MYLCGVPGVDPEAVKEAEGKLVYCESSAIVEKATRQKAADDHTSGAVLIYDTTLTTGDKDRDGDILDPKGARVDLLGPLLWNHLHTEPIGKLVKILEQNSKRLRTREAIINNALGRDVAQLIEFGAVRRMSHGFLPDDNVDEEDPAWEEMLNGDGEFVGYHIHRYEVMERSPVSVASNRGAEIDAVLTAFSRGKLAHPMVKGWAGKLFDERPVVVQGTKAEPEPAPDAAADVDGDPLPEPVPLLDSQHTSISHHSEKTAAEKSVPPNPPNGGGEAVEGDWKKPTLSDFTDKQWDDLSVAEKAKIAKHYAWDAGGGTFGDLSLPHHFPPGHANAGKASINGVNNAKARAGQVSGLGGADLERVLSHLTAHQPSQQTSASHHSEKTAAEFKSGRSLSKANEGRIREARDNAEAIGKRDVDRETKSLARSIMSDLDAVLKSAGDEDSQHTSTSRYSGKTVEDKSLDRRRGSQNRAASRWSLIYTMDPNYSQHTSTSRHSGKTVEDKSSEGNGGEGRGLLLALRKLGGMVRR